MGSTPLMTPTTVATRSPTARRTSCVSKPSTGQSTSVAGRSERQLTTADRARVCEGREKGSPEVWRGKRREREVDRERRKGVTEEACDESGEVSSARMIKASRDSTHLGRVQHEHLHPSSRTTLEHIHLGGIPNSGDNDEPSVLQVQRQLGRDPLGTEDQHRLLPDLALLRHHAQRTLRSRQEGEGHIRLERGGEGREGAHSGLRREVVGCPAYCR